MTERLSYDGLAGLDQPRLVTEIPGPRARAIVAADSSVTSPSLPRAYPFAPHRGAGAVVEDVDGNCFIDLNAAIAVCSTGHAHPAVVAAVKEQADRLLHYSASDFYLPIYAQLCARREAFSRTPGPKPLRPPSSWRVITPAARTCSDSSAPSTGAATEACH